MPIPRPIRWARSASSMPAPAVDRALDHARLQQRRVEAIARMGEVGPRRRRPQPRVDADEQQPQTRSDEIVDRGVAVRLQLGSREIARATTVDGETRFATRPGRHHTGAMPHPHWPLFDLEVRTPRLTLRYVDDIPRRRARDAGREGDPRPVDDAVRRSRGPTSSHRELERQAFRFWWGCRADTSPAKWNLILAALVGDTVVGTTSIGTSEFAVTRTFETGSWLGREYQGHGLGKEMRLRDAATRLRRVRRRAGDDGCVHRQRRRRSVSPVRSATNRTDGSVTSAGARSPRRCGSGWSREHWDDDPPRRHHAPRRRGGRRAARRCSDPDRRSVQADSRATSSASGSRWSRRSGSAGGAEDRVVEHAVGRSCGRTWRIEVGGADRSDHRRVLPASPTRCSRTNSYQLTAPWLVT